MFGIFVHYSTRPIYDVSMNLFCCPPSVDVFNILPGFLWQPLLRYSLTQRCDNGLENRVRPNLLKIDLSFPIYESTVPAARRLGQLQVLLEHERTWSFCFPAASMLVKNFTMSSAIAAENFFGGTRERKKLDSWTSDESFCRS